MPADATTGTLKVATPSGTLNSNVLFRVTPQNESVKDSAEVLRRELFVSIPSAVNARRLFI